MAGQINIMNPTLQDLVNARPLMRRCQNGDADTALVDANLHTCTNTEVSNAFVIACVMVQLLIHQWQTLRRMTQFYGD